MTELLCDTDSDSSTVLYSDPDIDDMDINGFVDPSTLTPLMRAVKSGNIDGVRNALKRRYHVNTPNNQGYTALHFAVMEEHVEIVRLLLENDEINVDVQDWMGMSPLMHACKKRAPIDIVKYLLESDCNVHLADNNQMTALWHVVAPHKADKKTGTNPHEFAPEIIELLTNHGADINAFSAFDETPISYVMTSADMNPSTQERVASALLYYGADPSIVRPGRPAVISLTTNHQLYQLSTPYYRIYDLHIIQRCNIHTIIDIWRTQTKHDKLKLAQIIQRSNRNLMQVIYNSALCVNQFSDVCAHNSATMACNLDCMAEFLHELCGTEELRELMLTAQMGRAMQLRILSSFYGDSMVDLLRLSLCCYNKLAYSVYRSLLVRETVPRKIVRVLEDCCVPIQCDRRLIDMNVRANIAWKMYLKPPFILLESVNNMRGDSLAITEEYKDYFSADRTLTKPRSLLELCRNTILNRVKCENQLNLRYPFAYANIIKSFPCPQLLKDILLLRRPI